MIVKIQKPLFTNATKPECLVYNEDRSFEGFLSYDKHVEDTIFKGEAKVFWHVSVNKGKMTLLKEATWQNW